MIGCSVISKINNLSNLERLSEERSRREEDGGMRVGNFELRAVVSHKVKIPDALKEL